MAQLVSLSFFFWCLWLARLSAALRHWPWGLCPHALPRGLVLALGCWSRYLCYPRPTVPGFASLHALVLGSLLPLGHQCWGLCYPLGHQSWGLRLLGHLSWGYCYPLMHQSLGLCCPEVRVLGTLLPLGIRPGISAALRHRSRGLRLTWSLDKWSEVLFLFLVYKVQY